MLKICPGQKLDANRIITAHTFPYIIRKFNCKIFKIFLIISKHLKYGKNIKRYVSYLLSVELIAKGLAIVVLFFFFCAGKLHIPTAQIPWQKLLQLNTRAVLCDCCLMRSHTSQVQWICTDIRITIKHLKLY